MSETSGETCREQEQCEQCGDGEGEHGKVEDDAFTIPRQLNTRDAQDTHHMQHTQETQSANHSQHSTHNTQHTQYTQDTPDAHHHDLQHKRHNIKCIIFSSKNSSAASQRPTLNKCPPNIGNMRRHKNGRVRNTRSPHVVAIGFWHLSFFIKI